MEVGEICTRSVISVRGDETVQTAAAKLRRFHVGDLVVIDAARERPYPIGLLTDRDIAVGVVASTPEMVSTLTCSDVLSFDPITVNETDDVFAAVEQMVEAAVRRLPVVDERGELVGILSMDDVLGLLSRTFGKLASIPRSQREEEWEDRP